jgi:acetyl esterase
MIAAIQLLLRGEVIGLRRYPVLDDEVNDMLEVLDRGFPAVETMSAAQARAAVAARRQPVGNIDDVARTDDLTVPAADGHAIAVRVYHPHPSDAAGAGPPAAIVFAHGGGFVLCSIESHDSFCRSMARGCGAVVISVDYRLAPEARAPRAAEDVYDVLSWAVAAGSPLTIDPSRIAVAGDSSGGNLAAAAALLARDRGLPALAAQVLLYPVLDPKCDSPSYDEFAEEHFNTAAAMHWYWENYLGPGRDPDRGGFPARYAAPSCADDLTGLAPAVLVLAGRDPLHDEGARYAERLAGQGVPVTCRDYPELFHGFVTIMAFAPGASARELLWSDLSVRLRAGSQHA